MAMEDPQFHAWLPSLETDWIDEAYPEDVSELLVEREEECDEENAYCSSSDDE